MPYNTYEYDREKKEWYQHQERVPLKAARDLVELREYDDINAAFLENGYWLDRDEIRVWGQVQEYLYTAVSDDRDLEPVPMFKIVYVEPGNQEKSEH